VPSHWRQEGNDKREVVVMTDGGGVGGIGGQSWTSPMPSSRRNLPGNKTPGLREIFTRLHSHNCTREHILLPNEKLGKPRARDYTECCSKADPISESNKMLTPTYMQLSS
jgi:hypothetical protein